MHNSNGEILYNDSVFVHATPYRLRFIELTRRAHNIQCICIEGERFIPGFTNLVGDIWYAFYKNDLQLKEVLQHPEHEHFLRTMMETEEYKRWHLLTLDDELLAILTTISLTEQLLRWLKTTQSLSFTSKQGAKEEMRAITSSACAALLLRSTEEAKKCKASIQTMESLNGQQVPLTDQFLLADALKGNPLLMKVAEMTGKFKKIAFKKQKQKERETMARQNITLGQEIGRLLPLELANYVMPHSKLDFLRKLAEHQTLVFDTRGKDVRGRGPIIVCMDESSSMTSIKVESKAFCLALLHIARKQRRDLAVIPFASDVGEIQIFQKGACDVKHLIDFSNAFLGGGTNYEKPLTAALDVLKMSKFNKADLIFVTDGSSFLSTNFIDQFNETKRQKQFECTTIVLNNQFHAVDLQIVRRFSTKVIEVDELFEASEVFSLH